MTNSTSNVHLDGNGNLDITALGSGSSWTSGRVQTTSANVGAPAGGELEVTASIEQPTGGLGYWPAFWMLGPGQWPENGEIDIMEDVNSLSELSGTVHCGTDPGGPCNEPDGIGSGLVGCWRLPVRLPHVHDDPQPDQHLRRVDHVLPGRQRVLHRDRGPGGHLDLAGGVRPQPVDHPRPGHGRRLPERRLRLHHPDQLDRIRRHDERGVRRRVLHQRRRRHHSSAHRRAPGRSPATRACAWTSAARAPPTSTRCRSTPATAPTPSSGPWSRPGSTMQALGKCLDINGGGTADGTTVDLYTCNSTGAQVFIPQSNGALYNPQSNKCRRHRLRRLRHPAADLGLRRHLQPAVAPALAGRAGPRARSRVRRGNGRWVSGACWRPRPVWRLPVAGVVG